MDLRYLFLPIALFMPVGSANAQHRLIIDRLTEWNAAAPAPRETVVKAALLAKVREIYSTPACSNPEILIDKVESASADRYAFNALIKGSIRNAWFVTARMAVCDSAPVRFMITQGIDASLTTIRVNRGMSNAWESLIGDTLSSVQLAGLSALKRQGIECTAEGRPALGPLRIVSEERDLGINTFGIRYSGSWTEVWPITACGRTAEVTVRFTADGDGGAYTRIPGDLIKVLP